mgnify:FL=1
MQSEQQENIQELHSCYASEDEMIMTEEIKQVLDEQSKEIWKEIEKKLFDEFMNEVKNYFQERFPGLSNVM